MRLALVVMFSNELPFLRLHIPISAQTFDGIVGITDPKTTDGSIEFMRALGADVLIEPWSYNWGAFATRLFNYAEALGYDAACRLDPDECLIPHAGGMIKDLLENQAALLVFPRHEFFGDRKHIRPELYPDYQARAWWLRRGIIVQGVRHEGIDFTQHGLLEHTTNPWCRVLRVSDPHIYHYGYASPQGIWNTMVKYQRHAHVEAGLTPPDTIPADTPLIERRTIEFCERQPLNPDVIGIYAPFLAEVHRAKG